MRSVWKRATLVLLLIAALALTAVACKKNSDGGTTYKTITFYGADRAVKISAFSDIDDTDLVNRVYAKDENGKYYKVAVVDKSELDVAVAGEYSVTLGVKDAAGFIKKSAEENWTVTRKVNVETIDIDELEITGLDVLTVQAAEELSAERVTEGITAVNRQSGDEYTPVADIEKVDTFIGGGGKTYSVPVKFIDGNGKILRKTFDKDYSVMRPVKIEPLYYVDVIFENGDESHFGSNKASNAVISDAQKEALGLTGKKFAVRAGNFYKTDKDLDIGYLYADMLGAMLVKNTSSSAISISMTAGCDVAVVIEPTGRVIYAYDGLNYRQLNERQTWLSEATVNASYANMYNRVKGSLSLGGGNIALIVSNKNKPGDGYDSTTTGCQFVLKNIAYCYGNYVRIYKGDGADLTYENSSEKITEYHKNPQPTRYYGNEKEVVIDVAYKNAPSVNDAKKLALEGITLLVNNSSAWNNWTEEKLTVANVIDVDGYEGGYTVSDGVKNFNFEVRAYGISFKRSVRVWSSIPTTLTFGFFNDEHRFTPDLADVENGLVIDKVGILRDSASKYYRQGIFSYDFFHADPANDWSLNTYSAGGAEMNSVFIIIDAESRVRVVGSTTLGVYAYENGVAKKVHGSTLATFNSWLFTGNYSLDKLVRPGEFVLLSPNAPQSNKSFRFWTDANYADHAGPTLWRSVSDIESWLGTYVKVWLGDSVIPGFNPPDQA